MQAFEIILMILMIGACQPSKKTQDSAMESGTGCDRGRANSEAGSTAQC